MKKVPRNWPTSIAFGWAFLWRAIVVYAPAAVIIKFASGTVLSPLVVPFLQLAATVLSFFAAAHWLRERGFGSIKLMLVEWAEYQKGGNGG